jgi:nucleotide-binding universal stress UspA family protein
MNPVRATSMRKVIAGFDGSDEARDGLHLAGSLADATGAELLVATAFGPVLAGPGLNLPAIEDRYFAGVFERARAELGGAEFESRELRDVSAPRGLDHLAEAEGADLIVVGSSHRGAFGRVLFGSVGERLLYGAPCAVAVAPRGYAGCTHLGRGVIGVAYDGSAESRLALEGAAELARLLGGEIRLITAMTDVSFLELSGDGALDEYLDAMRDHYRELQDEALELVGPDVSATGVLVDAPTGRALVASAIDLDLLVMGSRGYGPIRRTLLGGVSAEVMRGAPCPVLVLPRSAAPRSASTLEAGAASAV